MSWKRGWDWQRGGGGGGGGGWDWSDWAQKRPGDWTCPKCQELVFASHPACRKCGEAKPASAARPGDWTCPKCNDLVFGSHPACRKCGEPNPATASGGSQQAAPQSGRPGDWTCPKCKDLVFGCHPACRKCGEPNPNNSGGSCSSQLLTGDWTCPKCSDHVFARNAACRKCGTPRPVVVCAAKEDDPRRAGDWRCPKCDDLQFARNDKCRKCDEPRPQWLGSTLAVAPPGYWKQQSGPAWTLPPVDDAELAALRVGLVPGGSFGGRDQRAGGRHLGISVYAAWRLQHKGLWGKYAMERENMRLIEAKALADAGIAMPNVELRREFENMKRALPAKLDSEINEVYLSHGSKPESLLPILSGGLNERFSGGLFGNGTYLAEDVAKNDQYCTPDVRHGVHPELHKLLFDDPGVAHPGNLYYVFVCRALLGHRLRTSDGATNLDDKGRSIWSSERRELAIIQGSSPPVLHHCLLAETGGKLARFREFIIYHGDRIYPEYLVAYQRT